MGWAEGSYYTNVTVGIHHIHFYSSCKYWAHRLGNEEGHVTSSGRYIKESWGWSSGLLMQALAQIGKQGCLKTQWRREWFRSPEGLVGGKRTGRWSLVHDLSLSLQGMLWTGQSASLAIPSRLASGELGTKFLRGEGYADGEKEKKRNKKRLTFG